MERVIFSARAKLFLAISFALSWPCARGATITVSSLSSNSTAGTLNSTAINAAIASAQSGDTVVIPVGNFAIASSIQLKNGVNVSGAGQAQTTLKFSGTTSQPLVTDNGASNVQLQNFTLDGASSMNASEGIDAKNCSGLNIHSVTVQNLALNTVSGAEIGPQGIYFNSSVTGSVISGNSFQNIGENSIWGAGIRLSTGSNNNQVLNNTIAGTGRGGILCADSTGNTISGNKVTGSGGTGLGIEVQGCANSLIQNNSVDHWISVDTSSGTAIRGNTISDLSGVYKLCGLELVDSQNVVFSHNTVNGGAEVGISISGSTSESQIYFGHNTISGANTWGAQLQGGANGASEIYFESNTFTGTTASPAGYYPNQGIGFRFNGNAHFITLDNTQVTNNQGVGVQVGGDNVGDLTFNSTNIYKNGDVAIDQDNGLPDVKWNATTAGQNAGGNAVPQSLDPAQPQPTVTISAPTLLAMGSAGTFSANFAEAGGTLGNVLWDFGDGLPATGANATHTFALAGTYEVAVVVWDQTGYASEAEFDVTVAPEPSIAMGLMCATLLLRRPRAARRHAAKLAEDDLDIV